MKVVLLCNPQGNQRALAHRISNVVPLAAIVVVRPQGPQHRAAKDPVARLGGFGRRAAGFALGYPLRRAWFRMLRHYDGLYPRFPDVAQEKVADVNAPEVERLVHRVRPDLVVVSGTNLVKPPLIEAMARAGRTMNLHTGLSPYIRGGPNCTNWCLALRRFDLIGNTVMWLDPGIDTGNLIATERTALTGTEDLLALHLAVMEHAQALYVSCIDLFRRGVPLSDVPQRTLGEGRVFLTRQWTPAQAARAWTNFRLHYRREVMRPGPPVGLVSPTGGPTGE